MCKEVADAGVGIGCFGLVFNFQFFYNQIIASSFELIAFSDNQWIKLVNYHPQMFINIPKLISHDFQLFWDALSGTHLETFWQPFQELFRESIWEPIRDPCWVPTGALGLPKLLLEPGRDP